MGQKALGYAQDRLCDPGQEGEEALGEENSPCKGPEVGSKHRGQPEWLSELSHALILTPGEHRCPSHRGQGAALGPGSGEAAPGLL